MRVLILSDRIPPENRGGAGLVAWRLAQALQHAGHDVHVIAATENAAFDETRAGIPTYHLHSQYRERWRGYLSLYNPQTIPHLKRLYAKIQPDVINAHNIHRDLSYAALRLAQDIPTVFSAHDVMPFAYHKLSHFVDPAQCGVRQDADYRLPPGFNLRQMRLRYNPLRNPIIRHILRNHTHARTTPSHELARALHANDLPTFETVHNGMDVTRFTATPEAVAALRQRLNVEGRKIILFAGRLTRAKGTQQLLDALPAVVARVPEALLLVLSSVPIDEQITGYDALRQQHMHAAGWLAGDELSAAFHLAHVVVSPAIYLDPFPTVNLEAMAARTPVVATCYGGSPEAVEDGVTGYVVNPFDTAAFAARLTRILTDDALRQRMGTAGYARVTQHFTLQRQVQKMLEIYQCQM